MKSEERHEMETNVLAKFIVDTSEKLKPYSSHIVYGLLAVVAVWAIWSLSSRGLGVKDQAAWDAYATATLPGKLDAEELRLTATEYAGRPVGELSRLAWANSQLNQACFAYFADKKAATERLDEADKAYRALASGTSDRAIRQRAEFGVARVLEVRGEIDEAIKAYKKVSGPFEELAKARVEELEEVAPHVDATWLASAEGPARRPTPGGGARPLFSPDDLPLPGGGGTSSPGLEQTESFMDLLNQFQSQSPDQEGPDRYEERDAAEEAADGEAPSLEFPSGDSGDSESTDEESESSGLDLDLKVPFDNAAETEPADEAAAPALSDDVPAARQ